MAQNVSRFAAVLALAAVAPLLGEVATVETVADAVSRGRTLNGIAETLSISGVGDAVLIRFRTALIERWGIVKAVVAFHVPDGAVPPAELLVTAVRAAWTESSTAVPELPPGKPAAIQRMKDGWCTFALPREINLALATGAAQSIAITVPAGSTLSLHSRRTQQYMPYLLVRGNGPLIRRAQPAITRR